MGCVHVIQIQESSVYTNAMIKDYGTYKQLIVFKNNIRKSGFEEVEEYVDDRFYDIDIYNVDNDDNVIVDVEKEKKQSNIDRSIRRSKQKIRAIANLNEWSYFITLTFDKMKVGDRHDYDKLKRITLEYFKNQSKKYDIKYLLVPEPHKDGALHFHGLVYDPNNSMKLVDSGKKDDSGRNIYNFTSWLRYKGWNDVTMVESHVKCANYISKYVTKENGRLLDKYYYCSNGLKNKPSVTYCDGVSVDALIEVYGSNVKENAYCYMVTM